MLCYRYDAVKKLYVKISHAFCTSNSKRTDNVTEYNYFMAVS